MRALFCARSPASAASLQYGYNRSMEKLNRDRSGEIFQDELTENESKARGAVREDSEEDLHLDTDVDSEEGDEAMADDRFGQDEPKKR